MRYVNDKTEKKFLQLIKAPVVYANTCLNEDCPNNIEDDFPDTCCLNCKHLTDEPKFLSLTLFIHCKLIRLVYKSMGKAYPSFLTLLLLKVLWDGRMFDWVWQRALQALIPQCMRHKKVYEEARQIVCGKEE